eukprot:14355128-Alexandrium_andersonii.AAC.1
MTPPPSAPARAVRLLVLLCLCLSAVLSACLGAVCNCFALLAVLGRLAWKRLQNFSCDAASSCG